jgi:hypothetical protein
MAKVAIEKAGQSESGFYIHDNKYFYAACFSRLRSFFSKSKINLPSK